MMRSLTTLVLAACVSAGPLELVTDLAEVQGRWDIASFDGYVPRLINENGYRHAYFDIDGDVANFTIECNGTGMYAVLGADGRLRSRPPSEGEPDFIHTLRSCGDRGNAREDAYFAFLVKGGPTVALAPNGILVLRNAEHELRLRRVGSGLENDG